MKRLFLIVVLFFLTGGTAMADEGYVDRSLLESFYQNVGDTYEDTKTEGAFDVLADKIDANFGFFNEFVTSDMLLRRGKVYEEVIEKMINGDAVTIVAYGDSITYGYAAGTGAQLPNNYPATLQTLLREYYSNTNITVINRGYSGRQSDELSSDEYFDVVLADNPDLIIFMCGINDAFGNSYGPVIPVDQYYNNLKVINKKSGSIPIVFMTPTPVWGGFNSAITDENKKDRIYEYVQAVRKLREIEGMPVIDLYQIIQKDFYYRNLRVKDVTPDMVHYTDDYYKRIGEFVFAGGLANTDLTVSKEQFFPAVHSIFNFGSTTPSYYENQFNPQTYNVLLEDDGAGVKECFAYVFVDSPNAEFFINNVVWNAASSANKVTVDGTEYTNSTATTVDTILWDVKTYIATLSYGLHKIEFEAIADENNKLQFGFNGMTIQALNDPLYEQTEGGKDKGTIVTDKDFDILFEGKSEISTLNTSNGWNYKRLLSLGYKREKHYRLYVQMGLGSGIGLGRGTSKSSVDGNVYEAPVLIAFFETTGVGRAYTRRFSTLATWSDDAPPIDVAGAVSVTGDTFFIVDIIVNESDISVYMNGTLFDTITSDQMAVGELDLYLWSYSNGSLASNSVTKIFKVEEVPYALPVDEYREGDEYFDSVAGAKKIYNGTAWVTVTTS